MRCFWTTSPETFEFFLCSLRVARTNLAEALQLVAPDQTRHYEFRRTRNVQEHGGTLFCSLNCNGQTSATRLFMCFAELMKAIMASKQDIKKTGLPLNLDGTTRPSRHSCCCYNGFTRSTRRENTGFYKVLQGSTAFYNLLQPSWTN